MSPNIVKLGGLAGILAAALFLVVAVIDQVAPIERVYDSPNEYVYSAVSTVAFLAVVAAVVGVWVLKSRTGQLRRLAKVATWLVGLGYGFVAMLNAINLIQGERTLNMVRLGAALVMLIGSVILGVIVLVTHLLPWWCGVLMIIAFPLGHFANALFPSAENILYVLLWGSVGIALLARANAPAEPAVGHPARAG
jgi:Co/Zn/Cd efflux system component